VNNLTNTPFLIIILALYLSLILHYHVAQARLLTLPNGSTIIGAPEIGKGNVSCLQAPAFQCPASIVENITKNNSK
jgi:hypothetical protein